MKDIAAETRNVERMLNT